MSAAALRALHVAGDPLVLPNAWDAGSARLVAAAGFAAVATTSSGVADALGHADGQDAPVDAVLEVVARIARAVDVPVTADMEGGYGLAPEELAERLAAAGAVGPQPGGHGPSEPHGAQGRRRPTPPTSRPSSAPATSS